MKNKSLFIYIASLIVCILNIFSSIFIKDFTMSLSIIGWLWCIVLISKIRDLDKQVEPEESFADNEERIKVALRLKWMLDTHEIRYKETKSNELFECEEIDFMIMPGINKGKLLVAYLSKQGYIIEELSIEQTITKIKEIKDERI